MPPAGKIAENLFHHVQQDVRDRVQRRGRRHGHQHRAIWSDDRIIAPHADARQLVAAPKLTPVVGCQRVHMHVITAHIDAAPGAIHRRAAQQRSPGHGGPEHGSIFGSNRVQSAIPAAHENRSRVDRRRIPHRRPGGHGPHQRAIGTAKGVDLAIGRAEKHQVAVHRTGVQHRAAGTERPAIPACRGVDGVHHAGQRAEKHGAVGYHGLNPGHQSLVREQTIPLAAERRPDFRSRPAAARRVVSQHRPGTLSRSGGHRRAMGNPPSQEAGQNGTATSH